MAQYIPKAALVAEIEKRIKSLHQVNSPREQAVLYECKDILSFLDTLEVKYVDLQEEQQVKESAEIQHVNDMCKENGNSLTKKPVSEPNRELAETYLAVFDKKFPILPSLSGKQLVDYKNFLNKCQQIFGLREWGIRPIQSKLFEKLTLLWAAWGAEHLQGVGRQDEKEQDIPISEELEKACEQLAENARNKKQKHQVRSLAKGIINKV